MGWNRKYFKNHAKVTVKENYSVLVLVCIILMFISGTFEGTKEQLLSSLDAGAAGSTILNSMSSSADSKVVDDLINGLNGIDNAEESVEEKAESYHPTRGILAKAFNSLTGSGDVASNLINSVNHIIFKDKVSSGIIILLAGLLQLLVTIFFR
ncbi:MAG: hypothetical protein ACK5LL_07820 [Suipraeoptans sp.]